MIKVVNTATTDKVADVTNISTLLDKNNNSEQANITKIISENNETNTLTFIQVLEENNKQIKLEIMETLKLTIDEKNIALINKIDSKMKIMYKNFQTYLIRTTTKLVQSLQSNKQQSSNDLAILSQVYDEVTNSVAISNTSHNNSSQEQSH